MTSFSAWLLAQTEQDRKPAEGAPEPDHAVWRAAWAWRADAGRGKTSSVAGAQRHMSARTDWADHQPGLDEAVRRYKALVTGQDQLPLPPAAETPGSDASTPPWSPGGAAPVLAGSAVTAIPGGARVTFPAATATPGGGGGGAPDRPQIHPYAGSNPGRQAAGSPGHCGMCAAEGHEAAHPDLGCADVGCHVEHWGTAHRAPGGDYMPYHALSCLARTSRNVDRDCTCGGLQSPVWNPGDEPAGAGTVPPAPPRAVPVALTAPDLLLLRQRLADPGGAAADSMLDAKLHQGQRALEHQDTGHPPVPAHPAPPFAEGSRVTVHWAAGPAGHARSSTGVLLHKDATYLQVEDEGWGWTAVPWTRVISVEPAGAPAREAPAVAGAAAGGLAAAGAGDDAPALPASPQEAAESFAAAAGARVQQARDIAAQARRENAPAEAQAVLTAIHCPVCGGSLGSCGHAGEPALPAVAPPPWSATGLAESTLPQQGMPAPGQRTDFAGLHAIADHGAAQNGGTR